MTERGDDCEVAPDAAARSAVTPDVSSACVLAAACWVLIGCSPASGAATPAANGAGATQRPNPAAVPPDVREAVETIRVDSRTLEKAVEIVVASGNAAALAESGAKLVDVARHVSSPAWASAKRPLLAAANARAGLEPTQRQFDAQLELYRNETHASLLSLMGRVGGSPALDHCAIVARDPAQTPAIRQAALRVLEAHRPEPSHAPLRAEIAAAQARSATANASVPNASSVVASLHPAFKRCWSQQLARDPRTADVSTKLTLKIGANGAVVTATAAGSQDAALAACLEEAGRTAHFDAPTGGGATIVVPLAFKNDEKSPDEGPR
jgi:hypothetical protein